MPTPQTRKAWPRRVQRFEDVPQAFQPFFKNDPAQEFPYVIFDPAERAFSTRVHAKLICVQKREILIYEKEKNKVKETRISVEDAIYVEFGTILLYSWITVHMRAGTQPNLTLVFNDTAEPLYKPVIDLFRNVSPEKEGADEAQKAEIEKDKFDYLITQNHKFMNFGRKSIEPGEEVRRIVYQPEIKLPYLKLFGKTFYKPFLKTGLVVLTDTELILIKEPEKTKTDIAGVKCFLPLGRIKQIHARDSADLKKCILEIVFCDESRFCVELAQANCEDVKKITEVFQMQTGLAGA